MAWGTKRLYFWMIDIWAIIPCSRSCRNYLKQQVRGGGCGSCGDPIWLFSEKPKPKSKVQYSRYMYDFDFFSAAGALPMDYSPWERHGQWHLGANLQGSSVYLQRREHTLVLVGGKRRKKIRVPRWDLKHPKVFPFREKFKFLLLCGRASAEIPCT